MGHDLLGYRKTVAIERLLGKHHDNLFEIFVMHAVSIAVCYRSRMYM